MGRGTGSSEHGAARVEQPTWKAMLEKIADSLSADPSVPFVQRLDQALKAAGFADMYHENRRLNAQITEVLAETVGWQRAAQTPEERAWANVHHADITRALSRADR